jgi:hypothetical protein
VPPLRMPDVPEGPLRDLQRELHDLHARAGWPSTRELAKHLGRTHTAVHELFTKASVPRLPDLLDVVGRLVEIDRRASRKPDEVLDRFDALWSAANDQAVAARVKPRQINAKTAAGFEALWNNEQELSRRMGQLTGSQRRVLYFPAGITDERKAKSMNVSPVVLRQVMDRAIAKLGVRNWKDAVRLHERHRALQMERYESRRRAR